MSVPPLPLDPFPPELKKIGVISPASPCDPEKIASSRRLLEEMGREVVPGAHILSGADDAFFAAEKEERLADLNAMLQEGSIPLILCARGGYGSAYLLEEMDYASLRKGKKILCGYSDITALHLAMTKYDAGIAVACPMFANLSESLLRPATAQSMKRALGRAWAMRNGSPEEPMGFFTRLTSLTPEKTCREESCGKVAALNLTLFARLCGTKFLPDFRDHFLILEEVGEPARKIDFSLLQLQLSGALTNCKGIIFGDHTDCGEKEALQKVFRRFAENCNLPVWQGMPFGHGEESCSIVWGERIRISPDGSTFLSGGNFWAK